MKPAVRARARSLITATPAVLWVAAIVIAPTITLILNSVWTNQIFGVQKDFTLQNYDRILHSDTIATLMWRSVAIAAGAATLASLVAFPMAYIVVRYFRRRRLLAATLIIVPLWVSFLMRVFSWKIILGENGLLNDLLIHLGILDQPSTVFLYSPWAVAIATTYIGIPYVFLCAYSVLERISPNLYEASGDLGASPWRTLREVIWPIARPGVVVGYMLVFIIVFGDYVTPALVGGLSGTMVGSLVLQSFGAANDPTYGAALAIVIVIVSLIVLALASLFLRKRYVLEGDVA